MEAAQKDAPRDKRIDLIKRIMIDMYGSTLRVIEELEGKIKVMSQKQIEQTKFIPEEHYEKGIQKLERRIGELTEANKSHQNTITSLKLKIGEQNDMIMRFQSQKTQHSNQNIQSCGINNFI